MNKTILIGRVTKDIELRQTTSGKSVASFTLAVNKDFKNEQGGYDADFINCVSYGNQAEAIAKYVGKGDRFGITGRLNTRNYEKDGHKVYITEVVVDGFEFLGSKKDKPNHTEPITYDAVVEDDGLPF